MKLKGWTESLMDYKELAGMFYDVDRLADLIGVKPRTIWQYQNNGTIPNPFTKFGNSPVWTRTQVEEILENRKNSS